MSTNSLVNGITNVKTSQHKIHTAETAMIQLNAIGKMTGDTITTH